LRDQALSLGAVAAQHGLNELSLAVYELVERAQAIARAEASHGALAEDELAYDAPRDSGFKDVSQRVGDVTEWGRGIVDWQDNDEVQRQMRRDIKRELRKAGDFSEEHLNELVTSMIEIARQTR
jgi:type I restriction enzyme R subunit